VELDCRVLHPLKSLAQNPGNVHCHPKKIPLTTRRIFGLTNVADKNMLRMNKN